MHKYIWTLLMATTFLQCKPGTPDSVGGSQQPTRVELKKEAGNYQLYLNGKPFWINGAGLEFGRIDKLAEHGGNSFRTWRTDNGRQTGKEVLDKAQELGLYVTMGLEVARERHGFDYDDKAAVAAQLERIKKEVLMYKDHPALIIWAIGNELNLRATNPKVWDAVNEISKYIHEVDPNHLTTTTLAGINKEMIDDIKERAPDLDLLGFQLYADIVNLPKYIRETGWDKAYMVTEWGATGHWEISKTAWDIPIENTSSMKADFYLQRYKAAIEPYKNQCVGSYVFLWGQKQERTPTWYGVFLESGEETEAVDVMHYIWNGKWPENRTPRLDSLLLNGKTAYDDVVLKMGERYPVQVIVNDPENDEVTYKWDVKPESDQLGEGGDYEPVPPSLSGLIQGEGAHVELTAPDKPGAYRLFVYVLDGNDKAAHANVPFLIKDPGLSMKDE